MESSPENKATIEAYNRGANEYLGQLPEVWAPEGDQWLNHALDLLEASPPELRALPILEIGSGRGHGADRIEARGFTVVRTDATMAFVNEQRSRGHDTRYFNAITDDLYGKYSMVFATGVFPHFNWEEARHVVGKCFEHIAPGGLLVVSVKEIPKTRTDGEAVHVGAWRRSRIAEPRFYSGITEDDWDSIVLDFNWVRTFYRHSRFDSELGTRWIGYVVEQLSENQMEYVAENMPPPLTRGERIAQWLVERAVSLLSPDPDVRAFYRQEKLNAHYKANGPLRRIADTVIEQ